jgi:large subunit ribosomal protein L22
MDKNNMLIKSTTKYMRIGPRKVRPVLNVIRGKYAVDAMAILANINKKGARLAEKTVKSAMANAHVQKIDEANMFILDARADGGPILKRFMSRAMGRADRILKRTTHIQVVITEKVRAKKKVAAAGASGKKADKKAEKAKKSSKAV